MDNEITPVNLKTSINDLMKITDTRCWHFIVNLEFALRKAWAEREKMDKVIDWLAGAAAEYACPADGHVTCDKFVRTFANLCHCAESADKEYRKKCWLEAVERIMDARREAAEPAVGE